jgi:hypothetical protein
MKFLDDSNLARCGARGRRGAGRPQRASRPLTRSPRPPRINSFLDNVDTGDYVVYGDLEAYSCERGAVRWGGPGPRDRGLGRSRPPSPPAGKLAGLDKKLSKSLDQEVQTGSSPQELSMSPVGPLSDSARCAAAPPCRRAAVPPRRRAAAAHGCDAPPPRGGRRGWPAPCPPRGRGPRPRSRSGRRAPELRRAAAATHARPAPLLAPLPQSFPLLPPTPTPIPPAARRSSTSSSR